jgi:hypothetical protein
VETRSAPNEGIYVQKGVESIPDPGAPEQMFVSHRHRDQRVRGGYTAGKRLVGRGRGVSQGSEEARERKNEGGWGAIVGPGLRRAQVPLRLSQESVVVCTPSGWIRSRALREASGIARCVFLDPLGDYRVKRGCMECGEPRAVGKPSLGLEVAMFGGRESRAAQGGYLDEKGGGGKTRAGWGGLVCTWCVAKRCIERRRVLGMLLAGSSS